MKLKAPAISESNVSHAPSKTWHAFQNTHNIYHKKIHRPPQMDKKTSSTKGEKTSTIKGWRAPTKRWKNPSKDQTYNFDKRYFKLKTESSNCFSKFPPKRRKGTHQIFKSLKAQKGKIKQKHPRRSNLYCLIVGKGHMVRERGGYFT